MVDANDSYEYIVIAVRSMSTVRTPRRDCWTFFIKTFCPSVGVPVNSGNPSAAAGWCQDLDSNFERCLRDLQYYLTGFIKVEDLKYFDLSRCARVRVSTVRSLV
jgi:hypothetical protein